MRKMGELGINKHYLARFQDRSSISKKMYLYIADQQNIKVQKKTQFMIASNIWEKV